LYSIVPLNYAALNIYWDLSIICLFHIILHLSTLWQTHIWISVSAGLKRIVKTEIVRI